MATTRSSMNAWQTSSVWKLSIAAFATSARGRCAGLVDGSAHDHGGVPVHVHGHDHGTDHVDDHDHLDAASAGAFASLVST
jgi:hypothetical protein